MLITEASYDNHTGNKALSDFRFLEILAPLYTRAKRTYNVAAGNLLSSYPTIFAQLLGFGEDAAI